MADAKVQVEKLNDENYAVWRFKMELLLFKEGLLDTVQSQKPAEPDADWKKKDGLARVAIGLAVENDQLVHICRKKTSKEMWDTLAGIHEESNYANTLHILRKLCSLRLKEGGNLPEHLKEMTAMQNHLEMHDEGLKERSFVGLILSSLPPSYGSLINVIEGRPKEEVTLDYVKGKLRDEWRRRRDCSEDEQLHEQALKSFVSGSSKATDKKKKKVGACHNCGEEGHWQRDCPKPPKDRSGAAKANLAVERPAGMEMCLAVSGECSPNRWYLDSGATSHMTSDTSLLTNVDPSKQPEICLADGTRIKSSGAGNGKLVSVTGSGVRMLVNLADVYHVPSLAGNLLSVGRICDFGYVVCFDKVMRGKEVMLVGERNGGLYRLKEFPERALISQAEHPALCEHVWHRRLGHRDPDAVTKNGGEVQDCGDAFAEKPEPTATKEPETFEMPIGGGSTAVAVPAAAREDEQSVSDTSGSDTMEDDSELDESVYENASDGELSFRGFPLDEIARRSQRSTKGIPPVRFDKVFVVAAISPDGGTEPTSLQEALRCDQSVEWKRAMEEELQSHAENGTWELVPLPAGRKPVGCRWVYKVKRNAAGEAIKYKARLVAQGYCQKFGQDYDEVFAPVIKQTTLRMLLAIAGKHNLQLRHFDVKTAYLNGVLKEELYLKQPAGFEESGKEDLAAKRVVRYLKATKNWQLRYDDPDGKLIGYSDADWAGDLKTRKSTTGSVFLDSGGAISWASRLQQCVTLSSMESEFVALCDTAQEAVWLVNLMKDFGEPVEKPLTIKEDNQSCLKFVAAEKATRRSKHVDTKNCYVKELCERKVLKLEYCPTEDMIADVLTKPVGTVKHRKLSSMLGLEAPDGGR